MSTFVLSGNPETIAPIALAMGLERTADPLLPDNFELPYFIGEDVAHYSRDFKPSGRKKYKGTPRSTAKPLRPWDNGQHNDQQKAIEYARWLAARDGIQLDCPDRKATIAWVSVCLQGYKQPIKRPKGALFDSEYIAMPHTYYDPTIIPCEIRED